PGLLLWRAILQWIGGIGILVMAVSILPFLRVGGMQLYRMESSDHSEKLTPRVVDMALKLFAVYISLTLICAATYWAFGMSGFEAIVHAMTTLSTGGFSTSDQSLGHFTRPATQWTAIIFMLCASLPFPVYVNFIRRFDFAVFSKDSQIRTFIYYTSIFIIVLGGWLVFIRQIPPDEALRLAAFHVVSILSTTGYATADYLGWGTFVPMLFLSITLLGGCAGSTAGGIKAFRLQIMFLEMKRQCRILIYPHGVFQSKLDGRTVSESLVTSVMIFFFLLVMTIFGITLLLSALGVDFESALSAAATSVANVGPGIGEIIGPAGNFKSLPNGAKWILDFGMITGRLEIFTILTLFLPRHWEDLVFE
ncbi:MAG: TrkH family potassium uptake protein, partial [Rhodospirillales bacterium]|nr:TrkH family potassium uptake protein [Rhodospirillales bacterium]